MVESRDPKGLYKKARAGEIKGGSRHTLRHLRRLFWSNEESRVLTPLPPEFTGISAPYEAPPNPEIHIKTDEVDIKGAVEIIAKYLVDKEIIPAL